MQGIPKIERLEQLPKLNFEEELENRILCIHQARKYVADETFEDRAIRIENVNYALEDFCTGFLLGLKMRSK